MNINEEKDWLNSYESHRDHRKERYGECLSLQIILNNFETNAIDAGRRKGKDCICFNLVVILSSSKIEPLVVKER